MSMTQDGSSQSGTWVSAATVSSASMSWTAGDIVFAVVAGAAAGPTVSSIANTGSGLGAWAKVTDGTTPASTNANVEGEIWAASASSTGSGVVTATLSGTGAAANRISCFAITNCGTAADKVVVATSTNTVVNPPAATSIAANTQALIVQFLQNLATSGAPSAPSGYTTLNGVGGYGLTGSTNIFACLQTAANVSGGTTVTPGVEGGSQFGGGSSAITVLLKLGAPVAASAPTISSITTTGFSVNPGALTSGATSCNIQVTTATDNTFASPVVTLTAATPSSANAVTGLSPATAYIARTQMVNATGTTNGTATASTPTLCSAPTGLVVSAVANSANLSLSWTSTSGATTYNVLRSTTNGSGYSTFSGSTAVGTNSFIDSSGLTGNTNYYYVVQAVNASGASANSPQGTGIALTAPAAPTPIVATAGNNSVNLAWTNATGAVSVNVKRSVTLGGVYTTLGTGAAIAASTFTDLTAVNGNTYYYEISSINSAGNEGPNSGTGQGGYVGVAPPTVVTNTQVATTKVTVGWTPPAGPYSGYNIYRLSGLSLNGVPQRKNPVPFAFVAWGLSSWDDFSIKSGETYTYYVATVNGTLESPLTAPVAGSITTT